MGASNYVHITVKEILKETAKALLCVIGDDDDEVWIPLSQIADSDEYSEGDKGVSMSISEWFANQEGIEGE